MTLLTFAVIKYVLIACIWLFAWLAVWSLAKDVRAFLPPRKQKKKSNKVFRPSTEQVLVGNGLKAETSNPSSSYSNKVYPVQPSMRPNINADKMSRKNLRGDAKFDPDPELNNLNAGSVESDDTGALASLVAATEMREKKRRMAVDVEPTLFVIIDGPRAGFTLNLNDQPITIGRDPSNTVVLDDEFISARHAQLYKDPSSHAWILEDLGSTNGTYLDGRRIMRPVLLPALVPVRVGATTFELK